MYGKQNATSWINRGDEKKKIPVMLLRDWPTDVTTSYGVLDCVSWTENPTFCVIVW